MTHLLIIAILVMGSVRDIAPAPLLGAGWAIDHPGGALALSIGPFLALGFLQWSVGWRCLRRLDRTGEARWVARHERVSGLVRMALAPAQASAILVVGLLDLVRAEIGNPVLVDELLVALPPVAVLLVTWATAEPLERRMREALLIRRLDEGLDVPPMPRPWTWWVGVVRMQLLFAAAPILLILGWSEAVGKVRDALWAAGAGRPAPGWAARAPEWLLDIDLLTYGAGALQIGGVVVMLAFLPIALRVLWDTVPLEAGAMRDRLDRVCRMHRVRVRSILVWRTHGSMLNGAVIGFLPRIRYIILTDSLLATLPADQVEAVTAHEIAHVRHRHIPWLAASLLGSATLLASGASVLARATGVGEVTSGWLPVGVLGGAFLGAMLSFGWVSRRFERQADAFAAAHMAAVEQDDSGVSVPVLTDAAAGVMSRALRAVSLVNGHPMDRFTWRHGSITGRRRALAAAVGTPLDRLPANRVAGRVKLVIACVLAGAVGLAAVESALASGPTGSGSSGELGFGHGVFAPGSSDGARAAGLPADRGPWGRSSRGPAAARLDPDGWAESVGAGRDAGLADGSAREARRDGGDRAG